MFQEERSGRWSSVRPQMRILNDGRRWSEVGFQGGVGGTSSTLLTRVASPSLGHFTLMNPLTELHFATGGAFASKLLAGNVGSQVFCNFIMTFDYPHEAPYLRKSPDFGYAMSYNRTGVHLELRESGKIIVKAVNEGSPAAVAGLQPGDQLAAIGGRRVEGQAYSTVEDWFEPRAGQTLDVEILTERARTILRNYGERVAPDRCSLAPTT